MLHLISLCFTAVLQTTRVVYMLFSSVLHKLHRTLQFPPHITASQTGTPWRYRTETRKHILCTDLNSLNIKLSGHEQHSDVNRSGFITSTIKITYELPKSMRKEATVAYCQTG